MTYGQRSPASEKDPVIERALARASGTWGGYRGWRELDADLRLKLVDKALAAANDRIDEYPVAL